MLFFFPHSFVHLFLILTHSLTHSLSISLQQPPSFSHSSLTHSHTLSLPSIATKLQPFTTPSLPYSLSVTLPHSGHQVPADPHHPGLLPASRRGHVPSAWPCGSVLRQASVVRAPPRLPHPHPNAGLRVLRQRGRAGGHRWGRPGQPGGGMGVMWWVGFRWGVGMGDVMMYSNR